ncbi:MAG TPA: substrate-binding domain-containing protein [Gaiellaceae bacterium]|nr:substrate-binding domain-containing protein [Gaiellaceae bacterium]
MRFTRRVGALPAAVAIVLVVAASGSVPAFGRTDRTGADPASAPCSDSAKAKAAIAKVWKQSEKILGVPVLKPPAQTLCFVDTSKYKKSGPYTIAFASQGPTNSWASSSDAYVRYVANRNHVKLAYASANGDATKQVGNVQDLLAQNPDALLIQPMSSAIQALVHQAAQRNIPVVVCTGQLPDTNDIVSTVNRDYTLNGTLFAQWIVKQLHGKGEIAMISGIPGVPTAELQYQAAKAFFAKYPGIKIMTHQYDNWSPTQAKTVAASVLVKYPNLKAIWSDSSFTDVGVVQAYTAAHKPIPFVTGDSSNAFLRVAKKYDVKFALSAYPPEQCGQAVDVVLQILKGKPVLNQVPPASAVYTHAQLDKYYRPDCTDNLWVPSSLPSAILKQLKLC